MTPRAQAGAWLAVGLAAHLALQLRPAWEKTADTPSARDFASYYYAVKVAADGGDPYDVRALGALSRAEGTRRTVQPYFYPPPFLLSVAWSPAFDLHTASKLMLGVNEVVLGGCAWLLHRFYAVAPWALALLLATYSPIPDNAWMGQANLLVLLPTLLGLALAPRRPIVGGVLVGVAAMMKMSPALFLLYWALRGNWRAIAAAVATAIGATLLSLPLVPVPLQIEFYRDVLPGFARGDYHGLTVALNLPANHSIPDLYNRVWPGDSPTSMSATALAWSRATNLGALAAWALAFRKPGNEALALGALTILMTIIPAYTYEHHLVFLLLPVAALATVATGAWRVPFFVAYFFLAWPLDWLNEARKLTGAWEWVPRESKFYALVVMIVLCAALAQRAATSRPSESR